MRRDELVFERAAERVATAPPEARGLVRDEVRLLVSTPSVHEHARFRDLPGFLTPGTLLVVNRSATLPASLPAQSGFGPFLLNLSTHYGAGLWLAEPRWDAAQPGPLPITPGECFGVAGLHGRFVIPHTGLPRLWFVRLEGDLDQAMAEVGHPIRYGYMTPPYPLLAAYQTIFSTVPGSAETPSAARPFTASLVEALRDHDVRIAAIELHTGVSSLEVEAEEVEEQALYAEPFRVPAEAADAVNAARRDGRPVIAVGTTVVRALESAWDGRGVRPIAGFTRRFVHPGRPAQAVDALITGLHDPFASHMAMLYAIAGSDLIRGGYEEAVREGYLWHEFGDSHLILPGLRTARSQDGSPRE